MFIFRSNFKEKLAETLKAVLPILIIVLLLCFSIAPIPPSILMTFSLVRFPDLQVLAQQVPSIPNLTLILAVALGVAAFLVIAIGLIYTYIGLVVFLTGVNVGFMPAGNYLGQTIAGLSFSWIIVPIGMIIGYFIVLAEPAVFVLTRQVEEMTSGAISARAMGTSLSIGVSLSVGLAMIRVLTGISILWFLVPGYSIALLLTFFVPKIFTAIAFDSGGVASGPMTATFLLPFAMGACEALGGNIITDAFGGGISFIIPLSSIGGKKNTTISYRKSRLSKRGGIDLEKYYSRTDYCYCRAGIYRTDYGCCQRSWCLWRNCNSCKRQVLIVRQRQLLSPFQ